VNLSAATADLLARVERHAGQLLKRREDAGLLLESGSSATGTSVIDELLFRAKFVVRARDLLSRVGPDAADVVPLAAEFRASVEHVTRLVRTLISPLGEGVGNRWEREYLSLSQESLGNLMALCSDLSMVKNYSLDRGEKGLMA
jgi:hypothetical protein